MSKNLIVSGDLHLQIRKDLPVDWQVNRYLKLWDRYRALCEEHNASLVLSGDIFHNHKINTFEMQLFLELCRQLVKAGIDIWIISGNHDYSDPANPTLKFFTPFFEAQFEHWSRSQKLGCIFYRELAAVDFVEAQMQVTLVGHPALKSRIPTPAKGVANVLISHFRPTINEFIKEEIDVARFIDGYDLCIASDIHEPLELFDGKLVYTNQPVNSHFEATPRCGCILLSCTKGKLDWKRIPIELPNLVQRTVTAEQYRDSKMSTEDDNFYRFEVRGTPEELRDIETTKSNVKLVKIPDVVETFTEVEEDEPQDLDLINSLILYMVELELEEAEIQKLVAVFREA